MLIENGCLTTYCGNTRNVIVPSTATCIGGLSHGKPFYMNHDVETIVLSEGVEIVEAKAFMGCVHLVDATFPKSLKKIEEDAFEGTMLSKITYLGTMSEFLQICFVNLPSLDFTVSCSDGEIHFHNNNRS